MFRFLMCFIGLLWFFPTAHGKSVDVNLVTDSYIDAAGNMLQGTVSQCPEASAVTIGDCANLAVINEPAPNYGFLSESRWFLFSLNNTSQAKKDVYVEIDYALLDYLDFYVVDDNGQIRASYKTGDMTPFSTRPLDFPTFVFPVTLEASEKLDIRIFIETGSSMQVPVKIWHPEAFVASKSKLVLLFGVFVGGMFIMAVYNVMLYLSTKERSYLNLAFTLVFFALCQCDLTGVSYAYFWPEAIQWNDVSLIAVAGIALGFLSLFSHSFLRLGENSRYTGSIIKGLAMMSFAWSFLAAFISYNILIVGLAAIVIFLPSVAYLKGIHLWLKGYVPARYFVLAFSCFVFSVCVFSLNKFGVFDRNWFTEYAMHFGAAAVVTLLSMALADQVNQEKRDKEKAQANAIVSLRKFREIYNNSSEGMFRLTLDGGFVAANPAFLIMLKADSLSAVKRKFASFTALFVEPGAAFEKLLERRYLKQDASLKCVDGSEIWVVLNLRVVDDLTESARVIEGSLIDITDRKESESQLTYLANYDQLTGLINRNAFQERLKRLITSAQKHEHEHALLYIDLDRFKLVNDTCGHLAGDELLKQLGLMFTNRIRQRDATARIGGDEFVILLENCEINKAAEIGDELKRDLNKFRFNWHGKHFDIGASIGIVPINQYSESVVSLLNLADSVCLMAKEQGRNRIVVHDEQAEEINEKIQAKNLLATIHEAIESNNFVLFRQQIVSVANPDFEAYEILIRMKAGGDIVGPGVFIPTAERYNVMAGIDRWVVKECVDYLCNNPQALDGLDMVTINLSGQTLSNPDFLPYLLNLLERNPIASAKICFELTESAALNNLSESSDLVTKMKALGVRFAVDDFGSGYASYSYLTQLPIDFVKIDGSFCVDIDTNPVNQMVVRSITEISHTMGTQVIAEFVESKEALLCLQEIGVDMVQGYYLDRPSPVVVEASAEDTSDEVLPHQATPAYHT